MGRPSSAWSNLYKCGSLTVRAYAWSRLFIWPVCGVAAVAPSSGVSQCICITAAPNRLEAWKSSMLTALIANQEMLHDGHAMATQKRVQVDTPAAFMDHITSQISTLWENFACLMMLHLNASWCIELQHHPSSSGRRLWLLGPRFKGKKMEASWNLPTKCNDLAVHHLWIAVGRPEAYFVPAKSQQRSLSSALPKQSSTVKPKSQRDFSQRCRQACRQQSLGFTPRVPGPQIYFELRMYHTALDISSPLTLMYRVLFRSKSSSSRR